MIFFDRKQKKWNHLARQTEVLKEYDFWSWNVIGLKKGALLNVNTCYLFLVGLDYPGLSRIAIAIGISSFLPNIVH